MSDSDDVFGPALPPGMQQSYTLDDNSLDDGQYGPALPKSSAKSKAVSNKDSIGPVLPTTKELTQVIGPVLPPIYSSDSDADSVSSSERGQHPSFPHSFECVKSENKTEESDDDMIGPSAGLQALEQDLSAEVESRSLKMKEKLMSSSTPDEVEAPKQRESWMTELPEEMGASFGLGNRQFRTRAAPEQDSSWTEAPHEKGKKSKDEKKRKKDKYDNFQSDKEKKAAKEIEAYNKKHRPESLLEMHKKEMKKKKKKEKKKNKDKDKEKERRPFDRDIDLKVNRFDSAQKQAYIKRSQELGSRFQSGGTGTSFL